ncbi:MULTISPECIES: mechanosensitive ion channel family protein [Vagococcus]|uniref:mechanosensitive ion channel family protein n=1 Tax=Vagococcus TaxID=2737 RepID=UPI000E4D18EE|nr:MULTISPECIES: mechanosensitive ion channel family protein [Vagococcus]RHH70997.1 mechanosensitive ion channel family protein [Vagococcus sp. AM17-17]
MQETTTTSTTPEVITEAAKNVRGINRFFNQLDWNKIIASVINQAILILVIIILLTITRKILLKLIDKSFTNKKKDNYSENRMHTLRTLTKNAVQYTLFFIGIYSILTILGVPVGSLIAGAGIAGVAIGLGAQGFINDVLTGFFIIYERQLDVGDHVVIDNIEGIVNDIGLRTTQIKSFNGTMNYIPNRQILIVSNLSRGNQLVVVDIRVDPTDDIDRIMDIMKSINKKQIINITDIRSEPTIVGLVDLGSGNFAIRSNVYAISGSQFGVKTQMMTAYIEALTKAGIKLPTTPINLKI